jgi:hypothetical protein
MEKYQMVGLITLVLIIGAVYYTYMVPNPPTIATQSSPLNTLSKPTSIGLSATSFTTSVGKDVLTITPSGGYLLNETLKVMVSGKYSPQNTQIQAYSSIPLTLIKGGTGNATYLLPVTNQPLSITFIDTFSNSSASYTLSYTITGPVTNSTSVTG